MVRVGNRAEFFRIFFCRSFGAELAEVRGSVCALQKLFCRWITSNSAHSPRPSTDRWPTRRPERRQADADDRRSADPRVTDHWTASSVHPSRSASRRSYAADITSMHTESNELRTNCVATIRGRDPIPADPFDTTCMRRSARFRDWSDQIFIKIK